jgi:hypothetical protein
MNRNLNFTGAEYETECLDFRAMLSRELPDDNQPDVSACFAIAQDFSMSAGDSE